MKVDWDKIIKEDHKPSRASRRLVGGYDNSNASKEEQIKENIGLDEYLLPLSLIGGPAGLALGLGTYAASKITKAVLNEQQRKIDYDAWLNQLVSPNEQNMRKNWGFYDDLYNKTGQVKWKMMRDDIGKQLESEFGYNVFLQSNRLPAVNPVEEAAKELREQDEYRKITQENEAYAAQLRNEATRRDEAIRSMARSQMIASQRNTALEAAKRSATTLRGAVSQMQTSAQATAEARSRNLKSLQELATQRSAVANAEAVASQAIKANSAQILAQQDALRTKLRNEALAKQAAIGAVKQMPQKVIAPQVKVTAPQVKFGGSKASGYVQKLIAMYKDGLEVFDINKMKWASDNLKALGIMMEELPAEFPMGRNGLKKNRDGNIEPKMEEKKPRTMSEKQFNDIKANLDRLITMAETSDEYTPSNIWSQMKKEYKNFQERLLNDYDYLTKEEVKKYSEDAIEKIENAMTKETVVPQKKAVVEKKSEELDYQSIIEKRGDLYVSNQPTKEQMVAMLKADYPNVSEKAMKQIIVQMDKWRLREIKDSKIYQKIKPLLKNRDKLRSQLESDLTPAKKEEIKKKIDDITKKIKKEADKGSNVVTEYV